MSRIIYLLYDRFHDTYVIGGGSSTPARERIFYGFEQAEKVRNRYFKFAEIHEFNYSFNYGLQKKEDK